MRFTQWLRYMVFEMHTTYGQTNEDFVFLSNLRVKKLRYLR